MTSSVELYEKLRTAPDDQTRAKLIAEAFENVEERYPEITDLATASQVRESELRLQKEIEQVRAELKTEIEQVRAELKTDIAQTKSDTIKWTAGMLTVQLGLFGALVKLLVG
ncbi:MAG: hypothetical protein ABEJ96_09350 [Thiohalorhabdaceae bacterium]